MFFIATLGLNDDYNRLIWLLLLLDIGTVVLIIHLPFVFKEFFISSRLCCYRVYSNSSQILTLYKFKTHQTFNWQYTCKIQVDTAPVLVGFDGEWQMNDNKLYLKIIGGDTIAIADMHSDEIFFGEVFDKYYDKLQNQRLGLVY